MLILEAIEMQRAAIVTGSVIAIALAAAASMRAGEIPVDLSTLANEPWTYVGPNDFLIINGSTFPFGPRSSGAFRFRFQRARITTGLGPPRRTLNPAP